MSIAKSGMRLASIALAIALVVGCGGKEERKAKYLERGQAYMADENYEKARVEFKNVVQIDPKSAEGHYYLARIFEQEEEWAKAFAEYRKAVELDPENIDARARLGQFNLLQANAAAAQGNVEEEKKAIATAEEQRDEILKRDPQHAEGRMLKAALLARSGNTEKAIEILQGVVQSAESPVSAVSLLSRLHLVEGDKAAALAVLEKGVADRPKNVPLRFQLAKFYAREKRDADAARVMEELIALKPDDLGYRVVLASYYAQLDKVDEAEKTLRDAVAANADDPQRYLVLAEFLSKRRGSAEAESELKTAIERLPEKADLYVGLAKIYLQADQKEKAIKVLKDVVDRWSKDAPGLTARNTLAQIYSSDGDDARAKAMIEAVLAENPRDNEALLMKGKYALRDGDYTDAITSFRGVLKDQPENAAVLGLLARAHMQNGDLVLAGDNLQRAAEVAPQDTDARMRYVRYLINQKNFETANKQVDVVLKLEPDSVPALVAKTDILAGLNQLEGLENVVDQLKSVAPDSPEGYFRKGRLYKASEEYEQALAEYEKALSLTEGLGSAIMLTELIDLEIQMGRVDEAESRVSAALAENKDHPVANGLLGRIYLAKKEPAKAEAAFEKQIAIKGDVEQYYAELAFARAFQGNVSGAEQAYRQGLEYIPNGIRLHLGLAGLLERKGDFDGAIAAYEAVLDRQADNAVATNNLAALLVDHRTDDTSLARAKELALKFDGVQQPIFRDTLGWVYYKTGDTDKAVNELKAVVQAAPKIGVFQYHLGMAYAKQGATEQARAHLEKALELGDFPGREEAAATLKSLN